MSTHHDYHRSCQHAAYRLTCDEFDALLARSRRCCEICGRHESETARRKLIVDHDSRYGWAVRGLLCDRCNALMKKSDAGARVPEAVAYNYRAWFLTSRSPSEEVRPMSCTELTCPHHGAENRAALNAVTTGCAHWGHAPGEWKWSCCACSGIPGGCDNCTEPFCEVCGVEVPRGVALCGGCRPGRPSLPTG